MLHPRSSPLLLLLLGLSAVWAEDATNAPAEGGGASDLDGWEGDLGEVKIVKDKTWTAFKQSNPQFLVMFYAPWCGHCKRMKPDFADASRALKNTAPLVAVDCTVNLEVCKEYEVEGYPTVKWFDTTDQGNSVHVEFDGARSKKGIIDYVSAKVEEKVLRTLSIDTDLSGFKISLLKRALSQRGVDCVGCVDKADYRKKLEETLKSNAPVVGKNKEKEASKPRRSMKEINAERRRKEAEKIVTAGWEDNGKVKHMYGDDLEDHLKAHPHTLVMFYTSWCGHCTSMKPEFAKASVEAPNDPDLKGMSFVSLECDSNLITCKKFGVQKYPTVRFIQSFESAPRKQRSLMSREADGFFQEIKYELGLIERPDFLKPPDMGGEKASEEEEEEPAEEFGAHEEL